jgi:hypothetical protein
VPTVTEFNDRTLDTYSADLIRTCERVVLNHLEWTLVHLAPLPLMRCYAAAQWLLLVLTRSLPPHS